jgi:hypothetical protein
MQIAIICSGSSQIVFTCLDLNQFVLFLNDDWSDALEEPDCDGKLEIARAVCKCYNYQSN